MRSCKKIMALVLAFAMLATMFAFSASAEAAPSVSLVGPTSVATGEDCIVVVNLNGDGNTIGGVGGTITFRDATLASVQTTKTILGYNDAADKNMVIHQTGTNEVKFATLFENDGKSTRSIFRLTFTVKNAASFKVDVDYTVSNKDGQAALADTTISYDPDMAAAARLTVTDVKIANTADIKEQGMLIDAAFTKTPAGVTEYGVLFCPTQLLDDNGLTLDAMETNSNIRCVASNEAVSNIGSYNGYIKFGFADENNAAKMLGVKISAVAYYKVGETVYYSENTINQLVDNGVVNKAVLNIALNKAKAVIDEADASELEAYNNPTTVNARKILFKFIYDHAQPVVE